MLLFAICLLLGFVFIGISVYITSGYTFSREFAAALLQHLGLAICFPIIVALLFEFVSRERILAFVEHSLATLIDRRHKFLRYGVAAMDIGPDEHEVRAQMFKETEEATTATFVFLRAGLILRVLVPVFQRVMDKGGTVNIISPEHNSAFVTSVVDGLKSSSRICNRPSLPRMDTDEEIKKRDSDLAHDYEKYIGGNKLNILKTTLYIPYGCLLLERQIHGQSERTLYWFPLVVSKTCGFGPVFRLTDGQLLEILAEDMSIYLKTSQIARFQVQARAASAAG